jgi:hypothetical protein
MLFSGLERQREIDQLLDRRFRSPDEKREEDLKEEFAEASISQAEALLLTRRIQARLKLEVLESTRQRRGDDAATRLLTQADRTLLAHDSPEQRKADLQSFCRWHALRGTSALVALEEMRASICNSYERLTRHKAAPTKAGTRPTHEPCDV